MGAASQNESERCIWVNICQSHLHCYNVWKVSPDSGYIWRKINEMYPRDGYWLNWIDQSVNHRYRIPYRLLGRQRGSQAKRVSGSSPWLASLIMLGIDSPWQGHMLERGSHIMNQEAEQDRGPLSTVSNDLRTFPKVPLLKNPWHTSIPFSCGPGLYI